MTTKILNVGIDISLREGVISLLTGEGKYLGKGFAIPNNLPGAGDLEDRLLSILSLKYLQSHPFRNGGHRKLWIPLG